MILDPEFEADVAKELLLSQANLIDSLLAIKAELEARVRQLEARSEFG